MIVTEILTSAGVRLQAAADRALSGRLGFDGLDIPQVDPGVPQDVKNQVGQVLSAARWVGGAFIFIGLIVIGVQWAVNNRNQRSGGEENAMALGWWAGGCLLVGLAFSIAGWFL